MWALDELLSVTMPRSGVIMSKALKNKFSWIISGPVITSSLVYCHMFVDLLISLNYSL